MVEETKRNADGATVVSMLTGDFLRYVKQLLRREWQWHTTDIVNLLGRSVTQQCWLSLN